MAIVPAVTELDASCPAATWPLRTFWPSTRESCPAVSKRAPPPARTANSLFAAEAKSHPRSRPRRRRLSASTSPGIPPQIRTQLASFLVRPESSSRCAVCMVLPPTANRGVMCVGLDGVDLPPPMAEYRVGSGSVLPSPRQSWSERRWFGSCCDSPDQRMTRRVFGWCCLPHPQWWSEGVGLDRVEVTAANISSLGSC